ncbi:hypothetical protein [Selenomonas ruminantium]|uniref:hypothetical protein n=1 Tax=Selenomonas ruminantium TaxID=971 RepID=UPI0026EA5BC7|nr:hypothetical protein [Selenomonas ruminantium]
MVYLELLCRGYEVYVGSMTNGEVDFVAKNKQGLTYYQVSESTLQPDVNRKGIETAATNEMAIGQLRIIYTDLRLLRQIASTIACFLHYQNALITQIR